MLSFRQRASSGLYVQFMKNPAQCMSKSINSKHLDLFIVHWWVGKQVIMVIFGHVVQEMPHLLSPFKCSSFSSYFNYFLSWKKQTNKRPFFLLFFSNAWISIWKLTICKNCHNPSNDTLLLSCCCFLSSFSGSFVGLLIGIILFLTLFSRTSGNNICNACPVTTPMLGQQVDSTVQRDTQYYHDLSTLHASKAMTCICKIMDSISFNNCNFF